MFWYDILLQRSLEIAVNGKWKIDGTFSIAWILKAFTNRLDVACGGMVEWTVKMKQRDSQGIVKKYEKVQGWKDVCLFSSFHLPHSGFASGDVFLVGVASLGVATKIAYDWVSAARDFLPAE